MMSDSPGSDSGSTPMQTDTVMCSDDTTTLAQDGGRTYSAHTVIRFQKRFTEINKDNMTVGLLQAATWIERSVVQMKRGVIKCRSGSTHIH